MLQNFIINGKYNDESRVNNCFGKIEILNIDDEYKTAYVSWKISDEQDIEIAGITRNYFFGETNNPQEEIIKMILIDIQKYKINRRKIFVEIEVK